MIIAGEAGARRAALVEPDDDDDDADANADTTTTTTTTNKHNNSDSHSNNNNKQHMHIYHTAICRAGSRRGRAAPSRRQAPSCSLCIYVTATLD